MQPPFHPPFVFHLAGIAIRVILLFSGAFLLLWYYLRRTAVVSPAAPVNEDRKVILPLRLQAYERFVLFLERIHPSNLVMRLNSPDITAGQLQSLLVRTIREEFEYNLSQQMYISENLWEMIKNAKEDTIALVNQATARAGQDSASSELVREVFGDAVARRELAVDKALAAIRKELQQLF